MVAICFCSKSKALTTLWRPRSLCTALALFQVFGMHENVDITKDLQVGK